LNVGDLAYDPAMAEAGRGERVVIARWSAAMAIGLVVVTGGIVAAGLVALLGASGAKERMVLGPVAVALALPFLVVVVRVPPMIRGMGVEVDAGGIRPFDGRRSTLVPWSAVAAVGLGCDLISRHGTKRPSAPAFEIYLHPAEGAARYRDLRSD
jgi:hypothetical protein